MKYWKNIVIFICFTGIGVLLAVLFQSKPPVESSYAGRVDSLTTANHSLQSKSRRVSDSLENIVKEKDAINVQLAKKYEYVSEKYVLLRNAEPSHDTVVLTHDVYNGLEAIEKLPVLTAQLANCQEENITWEKLSELKEADNEALQKQFEACMKLGSDQTEAMKKVDKKRKWNKIWAVASSSIALGLVAAVMVVK